MEDIEKIQKELQEIQQYLLQDEEIMQNIRTSILAFLELEQNLVQTNQITKEKLIESIISSSIANLLYYKKLMIIK